MRVRCLPWIERERQVVSILSQLLALCTTFAFHSSLLTLLYEDSTWEGVGRFTKPRQRPGIPTQGACMGCRQCKMVKRAAGVPKLFQTMSNDQLSFPAMVVQNSVTSATDVDSRALLVALSETGQ